MIDNKTIVFATSNKNKIIEINKLLPVNLGIRIKSLAEINILEEIPETGKTITENAIQKAKYIYDNYGYNCFSEDTGLIIDALNGDPGIYSARYAGSERSDKKNIDKVLNNLKGVNNRTARFTTVIALIVNGELHTFEGTAEGSITNERQGKSGFGYDPIFLPQNYTQTFAEIGLDEKSKISHRAKALKKLLYFLKTNL